MGDVFELRKEVLLDSNKPIYNRRTTPETLPVNEEDREDEIEYDEVNEDLGPRGGLGIDLARLAACSLKKKTLTGSTARARGQYREPEVSQVESDPSEASSSDEEI
jgi:hypothetical protein